jgi:ribosome maturation protein SDO1
MKQLKSFDQEKASYNLAKIKKNGEHYEIVINPERIVDFKAKRAEAKEVLMYEKIFTDAKKGYEASPEEMQAAFGTDEVLRVAKLILTEGEIQFTQEYREMKRKEKLNRIIEIIARNAIDAKTGLPHPRTRIENAMAEAKVRIDDMKDAEEQVDDVVHLLKPIIPIKFAMKEIQIKISGNYAGKGHSTVARFGKILQEDWLNDGSWLAVVEIPAGIQNEFFDAVNKLTHGTVESSILK